jgi:4-amino-4-deoxy-L-arabinose transferase-like glycosyltransferase
VRLISADLGILILLALARLALHLLTDGQYGFHRDELATLDDARRLAWGYVAYPPLTPFVARLALNLLGPSLVGLRLFSAAAQCAAMVLTGLIARELGGSRWAQVVAALAAASSPISLIQAALFQYVSFDYLWWVLIVYCGLRLLNSNNPRWWLAIGVTTGLGLLTRYTIVFLLAGLAVGVLLTSARRWLTTRWLWGGVALAMLIWLPNLLWQVQHEYVSVEFLSAIHARDIALGRTRGYLPEQLYVSANPLTIPLWAVGLWFYLASLGGRRFRLLGWLYAIPFLLFLVAQGRSYYLAPAYPMLLAAGSVVLERWLVTAGARVASIGRAITWVGLALACAVGGALSLPIAPVQSPLWNVTRTVQDNFVQEIGWPELVQTVAGIYAALPADMRSSTAILTGNYGEAGAVDLYGPGYGLPGAISGVDSYWLRGYPEPPPHTLIVLGYGRDELTAFFEACDPVGQVTNRYGVPNEETTVHPQIFVCREPRQPWPVLWQMLRRFG